MRSLRPGDLALLFFAWYGTTRFLLETLRSNNWTIGGIAVASIISATFVVAALAVFAWRHRPGARGGRRRGRPRRRPDAGPDADPLSTAAAAVEAPPAPPPSGAAPEAPAGPVELPPR